MKRSLEVANVLVHLPPLCSSGSFVYKVPCAYIHIYMDSYHTVICSYIVEYIYDSEICILSYILYIYIPLAYHIRRYMIYIYRYIYSCHITSCRPNVVIIEKVDDIVIIPYLC